MSEDIQREPVSPRGRLAADEPDYPPLDYDEPPYPAPVKAAGVMWIVFGCMILLNMVAMLLLTFILAANMNGANAGAAAGGGAWPPSFTSASRASAAPRPARWETASVR